MHMNKGNGQGESGILAAGQMEQAQVCCHSAQDVVRLLQDSTRVLHCARVVIGQAPWV